MTLETVEEIILYGLIIAVIVIVIFYFLIYYQLVSLPDTVVNALAEKYDSPCDLKFSLTYREAIYVPRDPSKYEKKLATALLDTCYMTSSANCTAILPIENPPGFTDQLQLNGIEPVSHQNLFIGYIFWNQNSGRAIFCFSGTEQKAMWQADFRYHQVSPTQLNGYKDGMLVHEGFYEVYSAIRDQLWCWYNENSKWIKHLFICGHSLGASLASLSSFDFSGISKDHKKIISYFYGSPRVGNVEFAKEFDRKVPHAINVVNTEDLIPALVLAQLFGYTYETLGLLVPFIKSGGSLSYNHIDSYYYNLPEEPECAK
jgi:hypothetical protein